jgi:hypothetical protein
VDNFIDDNICNGNFQELLTIGSTTYGDIRITLSGRRSKASQNIGVQLLQKYAYVSAVNWNKLGTDTSR